jgi:hypothetical protein
MSATVQMNTLANTTAPENIHARPYHDSQSYTWPSHQHRSPTRFPSASPSLRRETQSHVCEKSLSLFSFKIHRHTDFSLSLTDMYHTEEINLWCKKPHIGDQKEITNDCYLGASWTLTCFPFSGWTLLVLDLCFTKVRTLPQIHALNVCAVSTFVTFTHGPGAYWGSSDTNKIQNRHSARPP